MTSARWENPSPAEDAQCRMCTQHRFVPLHSAAPALIEWLEATFASHEPSNTKRSGRRGQCRPSHPLKSRARNAANSDDPMAGLLRIGFIQWLI